MVTLTKDLKVRLLKAIKDSEFDGSKFKELSNELTGFPSFVDLMKKVAERRAKQKVDNDLLKID